MDKEALKHELLKELAYTVLADITHMSEHHVTSKVVELALQAEKSLGLTISNRATNEDVEKFWIVGR